MMFSFRFPSHIFSFAILTDSASFFLQRNSNIFNYMNIIKDVFYYVKFLIKPFIREHYAMKLKGIISPRKSIKMIINSPPRGIKITHIRNIKSAIC